MKKLTIICVMIVLGIVLKSDIASASTYPVLLGIDAQDVKPYDAEIPVGYEKTPFLFYGYSNAYFLDMNAVRPCMYFNGTHYSYQDKFNVMGNPYSVWINTSHNLFGDRRVVGGIEPEYLRLCTIPVFNNYTSAVYYMDNGKVDNPNNVTLPDGYSIDANGNLVNSENATYQYDKNIPTPSKVTLKFILPKLFEKIESQVKISWLAPSDSTLRTEISLKYNYLKDGSKIEKLMPYMTYKSALMGSVGYIQKYMETDLMAYIHSKNADTQGQTFANGKLNLKEFYVRYSKYDASTNKIKYGNWVKIDAVTGGTLDDGKVENTYDEVIIDDDGNETVIDSDEYGNVVKDNDGNVVANPKSFKDFTSFLTAIPNVLSATFTAIMSLFGSIGNFGTVFSKIFIGMPSPFTEIILSGVSLMIVLGIIKFLKG